MHADLGEARTSTSAAIIVLKVCIATPTCVVVLDYYILFVACKCEITEFQLMHVHGSSDDISASRTTLPPAK
jgi:hypothetical protein